MRIKKEDAREGDGVFCCARARFTLGHRGQHVRWAMQGHEAVLRPAESCGDRSMVGVREGDEPGATLRDEPDPIFPDGPGDLTQVVHVLALETVQQR